MSTPTVSGKEAHVCSTHTVVRVTHTGEHPLGPGFAVAVRTEEVEENSGVEGADGLLAEVVVVGVDLVAAEVVRAVSRGLHQAGVCLAELFESQTLVLEVPVLERGEETVELLLLVPNLVLFDDNVASQVLKKVFSESVNVALCLVVFCVDGSTLALRD